MGQTSSLEQKIGVPNFSFCNIMLKMITDAKRKGRSSFIMYVKEPLSVLVCTINHVQFYYVLIQCLCYLPYVLQCPIFTPFDYKKGKISASFFGSFFGHYFSVCPHSYFTFVSFILTPFFVFIGSIELCTKLKILTRFSVFLSIERQDRILV